MSEIEDDKGKVKFLRCVREGISAFFSTPPRYVWLGVPFLLIALSIAIYLAACKGEWVGLSPILLAAAAFPIVLWRMGLLDKQNKASTEQIKIANKNIEIQQQVGHRQNYFDSIKNLESESPNLSLGAIQELEGQLKTDMKRHLRIINILSSTLYKNTIKGNELIEEKRKHKIDVLQATLDALACRKPEWLPPGFELDFKNITFNKNTRKVVSLEIKNLEEADLRGADFQNTDIDGANFGWANLENANFEGTNIQNANFTKANLYGADFKHAACKETNFEEANLCSADLLQTKGITQKQINLAFGDDGTLLPEGVSPPDHWSEIRLDYWQSIEEWEKWMRDKENYIPPILPE